MRKYTEEDLRKAYQEGFNRCYSIETKGTWEADYMTEDEFINTYTDRVGDLQIEEKISFSYSFLRRKLDWEEFCNLTGVDYYAIKEGYEIKDDDLFYITESKAKQYDLL